MQFQTQKTMHGFSEVAEYFGKIYFPGFPTVQVAFSCSGPNSPQGIHCVIENAWAHIATVCILSGFVRGQPSK